MKSSPSKCIRMAPPATPAGANLSTMPVLSILGKHAVAKKNGGRATPASERNVRSFVIAQWACLTGGRVFPCPSNSHDSRS